MAPNAPHAVTNGLSPLFGLFGGLNSNNQVIRDSAKEPLAERLKIYGFSSEDELKASMIELREKLKSVLDPSDWNAYFGRSILYMP